MTERRPEVPADVEAVIKEKSAEFTQAIAAGDFDAAAAAARVRWEVIPDPKEQWDYYPSILPRSTADRFARAGDGGHAAEWLQIAMGSEPATIGDNVPLDRVAARVRVAMGDRETAERIAGTLFELYGRRPFRGDDSDLLPLVEAYRARAAESAGKPDPDEADAEGESPVPLADDGAATERPDLDAEIERLSEAGSQAMDDDDWQGAVDHWTAALEIIPAPRAEWTASTWLYTCLGDAYYAGDRLDEALDALGEALKCPEGTGSGFLWLRLGQVLVDAGEVETGKKALFSAHLLEGDEIFENAPNHLELIADLRDGD